MKQTVFVFGSNTEGIHGGGAAREAMENWGAEYLNPSGLQGNSYAIITKDLNKGMRSVSLEFIEKQVKEFNQFAIDNPNTIFIVTGIGLGLAGFLTNEIKPMFTGLK